MVTLADYLTTNPNAVELLATAFRQERLTVLIHLPRVELVMTSWPIAGPS